MIKQLRQRIILMNMLLIGIVILGIFTVVTVNSYFTSVHELEQGLGQVLERNNGIDDKSFRDFHNAEKKASYDEMPQMIGKPDTRGEMPVQLSSYITVTLDKNGEITDSYESNVTIEQETMLSCIEEVMNSDRQSGQLSQYGLMYVKSEEFGMTRIAFADNSNIYSALRNSILISVGLFIGSMVIIFLISLGLSGISVKPVKEAWEKQKQFVADASHELKTPLTVILANNNIMMSHVNSTVMDEKKWLESNEEEAQHMKQLIDQMLFLAKSDAGGSTIEFSKVNFSEIVEGVSLNFEPVAFEKEIEIDAEITPGIVVNGNSLQLNQLAHILIDNAVKYAQKQTCVKIILTKKNDIAEFSVNNAGSVIDKEDLEHIFDRFYRAEKSRTTKGYGLGLSIAQNIVQSMNGRLTVQSSEQGGTTFTARIAVSR